MAQRLEALDKYLKRVASKPKLMQCPTTVKVNINGLVINCYISITLFTVYTNCFFIHRYGVIYRCGVIYNKPPLPSSLAHVGCCVHCL